MSNQRPIFIIGVHRSGTTLLRFMLSSSPRIYIPPESDFIPRFFGRNPTEEMSCARIERVLKIIFNDYRFVKEWQGKPPIPRSFIAAMPKRTPAAFLDTLYNMYAEQHGAVRWGDKTPIYTSYMDLIHQIFPDARFIHIIRDGRDVALSMLDKWKHEIHIDIYFTARNWVRRVRQAQVSGGCLGRDLYYELHYEDLVADPEVQLASLCDFLDEPFMPEMAKPHLLARRQFQAGDFHAAVRRPPNMTRIRRWQDEMSRADLRLFQSIAGPMLSKLGYEVSDLGPMPADERLRLAMLATKYETLQAGRRFLQALNMMPPI